MRALRNEEPAARVGPRERTRRRFSEKPMSEENEQLLIECVIAAFFGGLFAIAAIFLRDVL